MDQLSRWVFVSKIMRRAAFLTLLVRCLVARCLRRIAKCLRNKIRSNLAVKSRLTSLAQRWDGPDMIYIHMYILLHELQMSLAS